jgi:DNA-binding transcriptional ArsR family regulator
MSPEDRPVPEPEGSELVVLARAFGHPTRSAILQAFFVAPSELRTPSSLASSLEQSTAVVSYHVRVLVKLGILELRAEEAVRGAIAHHYALNDGWVPVIRRLANAVAAVDD